MEKSTGKSPFYKDAEVLQSLPDPGIEPGIPLLCANISESCESFPNYFFTWSTQNNLLLLPITTQVAEVFPGNPTFLALLITHRGVNLCFTRFFLSKPRKLHHYVRNDRKAVDLNIQKRSPQIIHHTR